MGVAGVEGGGRERRDRAGPEASVSKAARRPDPQDGSARKNWVVEMPPEPLWAPPPSCLALNLALGWESMGHLGLQVGLHPLSA